MYMLMLGVRKTCCCLFWINSILCTGWCYKKKIYMMSRNACMNLSCHADLAEPDSWMNAGQAFEFSSWLCEMVWIRRTSVCRQLLVWALELLPMSTRSCCWRLPWYCRWAAAAGHHSDLPLPMRRSLFPSMYFFLFLFLYTVECVCSGKHACSCLADACQRCH